MQYDLSHLTQPADHRMYGPIQDDEALFLYGFIKTTLIRNVVELGFLSGYSARNFLAAVGPKGKVLSIDVTPFISIDINHIAIVKNVQDVTSQEIPFEEIDLLFCDTHHLESTIAFYNNMVLANKITDNTTIVLHDTGLHHKEIFPNCIFKGNGWVHQLTERKVSDFLVEHGWHAIHAHGNVKNFDGEHLACRHGLTILQKKRFLEK